MEVTTSSTTTVQLYLWRGDTSPWVEVIIEIFIWFLCIFTVIGNVLVLVVFIRDRQLRAKISNLFILNLAMADLLVGCVSIPLNNLYRDTGLWPFTEEACKFWITMDFSECTVSVWAVVLISYDRYLLVTKGLEYDKLQTLPKFLILSALLWTISYLRYICAYVGYGWFVASTVDYSIYCDVDVLHQSTFIIYDMVTSNVIPVGLTAYFNTKLYLDIRTRSRGLPRNWASVEPETSVTNADGNVAPAAGTGGTNIPIVVRREGTADIRKHRKAAITLALIVGVSSLCWIPYFTITFLQVTFGITISTRMLIASYYIFYANSAVNPLLYVATNPRIRNGMAKIMGLRKRKF
ncbi:histamine H3 receptor-like [Amphiura filiformis]|uniref:histamine H3 receptor-like n=1 Tax=Amphiura filiformis TaxID=82378 RepID=UPI003B227A5A